MSTIINSYATTPSTVVVSFSWTPSSTYTYTAPNSIVLSGPSAVHGINLNFSAATTIVNQGNELSGPLTIIEYRWDFGDGTIGYGQTATHNYVLPNFQAVTKLRVTDSKNRYWYARAQMYLS